MSLELSNSGLPVSLHSRQSLHEMHMEVQEDQSKPNQQNTAVPTIPLANLDLPPNSTKLSAVGSKRRQTNEGSAGLGIDIQLLASTDKIMNTERDISKEKLSPPGSEAGSSFRQSQYGDKAQMP